MLINEKNETEIIKEFNRIVSPHVIPDDLNEFELTLGVFFRHVHNRLKETISTGESTLNSHLNKLKKGIELQDFHNYFPQSSGILQGMGPEIDIQVGRLGILYEIIEDYLKCKFKARDESAEKTSYENKPYIHIWKEVVLNNMDCKENPKNPIYFIKAIRKFASMIHGNDSLNNSKAFYYKYLGPADKYHFRRVNLKTYKLYTEFINGLKVPTA
jgi:hypothetical protein